MHHLIDNIILDINGKSNINQMPYQHITIMGNILPHHQEMIQGELHVIQGVILVSPCLSEKKAFRKCIYLYGRGREKGGHCKDGK
mmetsp:Transcript_20261/g.29642  ORF Transcript_20261/g.29642 Transcript_20261/m.29642 type:complete len:85 (+) Transcript_20261:1481-1735(+)